MESSEIVVRESVERLMDLSTVIGDLTASPRTFERLAPFLSEAFGLEGLVLVLVEQEAGGGTRVVMESCCSQDAWKNGSRACSGCFDLETLLRTEQELEGPTSWRVEVARGLDSPSQDGLARIGCGAQLVISKPVDASHRLILAFAHPYGWSEQELDIFHLTVVHLAKAVKSMVLWHPSAAQLGAPFDRLTKKEWRVLVGLNSDDGEKQLADRMELSPHTLHSHIKAIYRKVGVQGRLPLLQKLQESMADYRRRRMLVSAKEPAAVLGRAAC